MTSGGGEAEDRMQQLARSALQRSIAGKMEWRATDDDNLFIFSGSQTSLTIDFAPRDDSYRFSLLNARGVIVNTLSWWPGPDPEDPWEKTPTDDYMVLRDLHNAARRNALKIDQTLDQAFRDLDNPSGSQYKVIDVPPW